MAKYQCIVCGYIYDEDLGDDEQGIKAGTKFEDLEASWICPLCQVSKDEFEQI